MVMTTKYQYEFIKKNYYCEFFRLKGSKLFSYLKLISKTFNVS